MATPTATNPVAMTPMQIAASRDPAPSVVTSQPARTQLFGIQNNMNTMTAGQQQQSVNNQQVKQQQAQQTAQNRQQNQQNSQVQADNQGKIQAVQKQLKDTQTLLNQAQGLGYTGNEDLQFDSQGNMLPPVNQTNTSNAATNTPSVNVPPGIDTTNQAGQIQFYKQNPDQFTQWAQSQGWSNTDIYNLQVASKTQDLQNQINQANTSLQQFSQGTFPLNPDQQSQLDALSQQWDRTISAQQEANVTYQNGAQMLAGRTGRAEYNPINVIGDVNQSIQQGLDKVAYFQQQKADELAKMRSAFMQQNYQMVSSANEAIVNNDKQILDTMQSVHKDMVAAQQQAFDNAEKTKMDNAKLIMDDHTMSYQDKTQALDQLKLNEQVRHDKQDELIQQETASKGTYQLKDNPDGTQSIFDTRTGEVIGNPTNSIVGGQFTGTNAQGQTISPGNTGIPILDNNTKQSISGVWYIDGTNLTKTQQESASREAAQLGIPYLGKDGQDAQANVDTAKTNLKNIQNSLKDVNPSNAVTRALGVGEWNATLGQWLQTSDALTSFNAYRAAAIQALRAMAGSKGLRINNAEITNTINNDIPTSSDTIGTATAKIEKVNQMLDSQERGLFGQNYDVMKVKGTTSNSTDALKKIGNINPAYMRQIQQIHQAFPQYTDDEILQVFNPNLNK